MENNENNEKKDTNEKRDPLWVRICAAAICVLLVAAIEIVAGGLLFMLCIIIFKKTCGFMGITYEANAFVMAFLFGFLAGNTFLLVMCLALRNAKKERDEARAKLAAKEAETSEEEK